MCCGRPGGDNPNDLCLGEGGSTSKAPCARRLPDSAGPDVQGACNARELRDLLMDSRSGTYSSAWISAMPSAPGPASTPQRQAGAGDVRFSALRPQEPGSVSNLSGDPREWRNNGYAQRLGRTPVDVGSAVGHDPDGHDVSLWGWLAHRRFCHAVADPGFGEDVRGTGGIVTQLVAQLLDVCTYDPRVAGVKRSPDQSQ